MLVAIGWVAVLVGVVAVPPLTRMMQPKIVEKIMWRVKTVEVIKEVPVFKGEKTVEKLVYVPAKVDIFIFDQVNDDVYKLYTNDPSIETWEVKPRNDHALIKLKRREVITYPNHVATSSSLTWR